MNWDKLIGSFIVGVGLLVFLASCLQLAVSPPTDSIDIATQVESLAARQGVAVVRESSFEYRFSESEGFGGAGGTSRSLVAAGK